MNRSRETRSPIKQRPLPTAGQSLDRKVFDVIGETVAVWVGVATAACLLAFYEWMGYLLELPRIPWVLSCTAIFLVIVAAIKIRRTKAYVEQLRQGRAGEMAVGQFLEHLRADGYRVLHDLPGDENENWNIDHVLIGPGGIFAIETKTPSKVDGRENVIEYDGERVTVNGHQPDRDPIKQARGSAARIKEVLEELTGRNDIPVRPVVLYPGWFIRSSPGSKTVWVLEPKALPKWLKNEQQRLSQEDIALYNSRLAGYVRDVQDKLYD